MNKLGLGQVSSFLGNAYSHLRASLLGPRSNTQITAISSNIFQDQIFPYLSTQDLSRLAMTCRRMRAECDEYRCHNQEILKASVTQFTVNETDESESVIQIPRSFAASSKLTADFLFDHWGAFMQTPVFQKEIKLYQQSIKHDWIDHSPTAGIHRIDSDEDPTRRSKNEGVFRQRCEAAIINEQLKIKLSSSSVWSGFDKATRARINLALKALAMSSAEVLAETHQKGRMMDALAIMAAGHPKIISHKTIFRLIKDHTTLTTVDLWGDFVTGYYKNSQDPHQVEEVFKSAKFITDENTLKYFLGEMVTESFTEPTILTRVVNLSDRLTHQATILDLIKKVIDKYPNAEEDLPNLLAAIFKIAQRFENLDEQEKIIDFVLEQASRIKLTLDPRLMKAYGLTKSH